MQLSFVALALFLAGAVTASPAPGNERLPPVSSVRILIPPLTKLCNTC